MLVKYFWYPASLKAEIEKLIEDNTSFSVELYTPRFLYILHKLYHSKSSFPSLYNEVGIRLNNKILSEALRISTGDTSKILKCLIDWDFIVKVGGYVVGDSSIPYRLSNRIETLKVNRNEVKAEKAKSFLYQIQAIQEAEINAVKITKYQHKIYTDSVSLNKAGLDYLKAKYPDLEGLIDAYPNIPDGNIDYDMGIDPDDIILFSFLFKDYFVTRPEKGNRMYSNIACLHTPFRQFINIDGLEIVNTDITNSQVVFGAFVLQNYFKMKAGKIFSEERLPEDFKRFKALSISGQIYEVIAEEAGLSELIKSNRKEFKQTFFREVWFAKVNKTNHKVKKAFKGLFPSVFEAIEDIKKDNHAAFPIKLQKLEAGMMLDNIGKKLMQEGIKFLTIHDSFVVNNEEDLKYVEELIKEEFMKEYGCVPHFKHDTKNEVPLPTTEKDEVLVEKKSWISNITGNFKEVSKNILAFPDFTLNLKSNEVKYNKSKKGYIYSSQKLESLLLTV